MSPMGGEIKHTILHRMEFTYTPSHIHTDEFPWLKYWVLIVSQGFIYFNQIFFENSLK